MEESNNQFSRLSRSHKGKQMLFGLSGLGLGVVCIFTLNTFEAFVLSIATIGAGATSYVWG